MRIWPHERIPIRRYNVPASELKRLNNILRDSEFHALSRVKVPAKPGSALSEMLKSESSPDSGAAGDLAGIHLGAVPKNSSKAPAPPSSRDNNNGWVVEHFSSPPAATSANSASSAYCSSEVSSPVFSGGEEETQQQQQQQHRQSSLNSSSASKEVRKAKRMFKSLDRELASIRLKNDAITSTRIVNGMEQVYKDNREDEEDEASWEEVEDEEEAGKESLLPNASKGIMPAVSTRSKVLCALCLAAVALAVVVILLLADRWYEQIRREEQEALRRAEEEEDAAAGKNDINS